MFQSGSGNFSNGNITNSMSITSSKKINKENLFVEIVVAILPFVIVGLIVYGVLSMCNVI
jgi:hypothetical protein